MYQRMEEHKKDKPPIRRELLLGKKHLTWSPNPTVWEITGVYQSISRRLGTVPTIAIEVQRPQSNGKNGTRTMKGKFKIEIAKISGFGLVADKLYFIYRDNVLEDERVIAVTD